MALPVSAIVGGQATEAFPEVGQWSTGASGVQVAPSWVLTARHIAPEIGTEFRNGLGKSTVAARYYFSHDIFPAHDLSLLRLATPIGSAGSRQIAIWAERFSPGPLVPTDVTMVSGQNQHPRGYAPATLRLAVTGYAGQPSGSHPALTVNHLICHGLAGDEPYLQGGDSGGALFLGHVSDSTAPLLGLASAQTRYKDGAHSRVASAFVQLALYRDWIDRTMREDDADEQTVRWARSAAPEAGTADARTYGIAALSGAVVVAVALAWWRRDGARQLRSAPRSGAHENDR